jgi:sugar transferase (PEP-CTERM/EpsH1 system associated)
VSPAEAALFHRLAPESAARVSSFGNGVDTEYFSPDAIYQNPFGDSRSTIVFTGAMDYWPNVDAVTWFAREAFPVVQRARPDARFCIVGSRPTSQVLELGRLQGVEVTGTVPDVRPYLAHARMIVAPLRIARGVQNKVLEAMAMGRPTLVTPQALEGIDAEPGRELVLAPEDGAAFGEAALQLLGSDDVAMGRAARDRVMRDYAWSAHLKVVGQALDRKGAALPESDTAGSAAITSLGGMAR